MIDVAIMGFGTVGSGVAEVLTKNKNSIAKKAGDEIRVKYILDVREFPDSPFSSLIIHDFDIIANDPDIKVVIEVIGGVKIAYEFTKRCLAAGKHVVTSNKELVATYGAELLNIAKESNLNYLFEASVGGGIPIIRPLNQCLAANEIESITGILNGTTNYILTRMIYDQKTFDEALSEAKQKGYAEADPTADIDGHDACRKIAILSSLAFGRHVDPKKIHTEGIRDISLRDVEYADKDDRIIKLLARSVHLEDGRLFCIVCPYLLKSTNQLANVDDVFNGILISGDAIGDVMFYGRGAGKLPTASAVVADIIDSAKHLNKRSWVYWKRVEEDFLIDYREFDTAFYVRVECTDKQMAKKAADKNFGNCYEMQKNDAPKDEFVFITPVKKESLLLSELERLKSDKSIKSVTALIRVLD